MNLTHLIDEYNHGKKTKEKLIEIIEENWNLNDLRRRFSDHSDTEVIAVVEGGGRFTLYEGTWKDNRELFIKLDDEDVVELKSIDEYIQNNQLTVHRDFTFGYLGSKDV
jgi:cupin superfamily acireductone dioxygenase involved in methionine salvage